MHRYDEALNLVSQGEADLAGAIQELRDCARRAETRYESGEESIAATSFTLSRDERDFLQVNCESSSQVRFWSDRLHYGSLWARLAGKGHIEITTSMTDAESVIGSYFELSRERFEESYTSAFTR